jgi:protein TonB
MRVYMTKFQDSPPLLAESGLRGLQQVASAILESRTPGIVGAVVLLALAAVGLASSFAAGAPARNEFETPHAGRAAVVLTLASIAVLSVAALVFWETRLASWLVRSFAEGPLDFRLISKFSSGDIHAEVGRSVAGLGFLCILSVTAGLLLAVLAQAVASVGPPRRFVRGNVLLLVGIALIALATLFGEASQSSWLREIVATGRVPGVVAKEAAKAGRYPPCAPHPAGARSAVVGTDVSEPIEIERVKPIYPETARLARIQGTVILEAVVEKDGTVSSVCVRRGVDPRLDDAASRAVLQWRYRPATWRQGGAPVAAYLTVTVTFRLE